MPFKVYSLEMTDGNMSRDALTREVAVHANNQYKGYGLRRADGTYTPTYNYFKKLFQEEKQVKNYSPNIEVFKFKN